MSLPLSLDRPWWLIALALVPLCVWLRLRPDAPPALARVSAAVRALLLCCLVLALAGLKVWRRAPGRTVLFLLDRSQSLDAGRQGEALRWVQEALRHAPRRDSAGVILFGSNAMLEASPQRGLNLGAPEGVVDRDGTDVAAALRLARAILPAETSNRVVLLSDGNETAGDMMLEGVDLSAVSIPVDVVPLASEHARDVLVARLNAPAEVSPREGIELRARIWSSSAATATARLFRDERLLLTRSLALPEGESVFSFPDRLEEPGFHSYRLYLDSPGDSRPENNQAAVAVSVIGPSAVLLVDGEPGKGAGLAAALSQAGMRVRSVGPGGVPRSLAEMESYAGILLSDLPAYAMSPRTQAELRSYVGDLGGGLAMFGGQQSFGVGGYLHSPVEEALPVSMESKRPGKDLSLAIVIVIDRSGSMAQAPFGVQKIELANEGAMRVVEMLSPHQSIGVCAVDTSANWIVPLQPAADKTDIIRRIGGLRAGGGGIYVFTGMEAAYGALAQVKASVRHVILFSDAADSEEQVKAGRSALDFISQMAAEGITVSVVGLGTPADVHAAFLEESAGRGKGRYYLTEEIRNVPSIFMRETVLVRRSALIEEPFIPSPKARMDIISGIDWDKVPELKGYVLAEAKEAAEVGLATHRGDPLLATWRYGLGKSLAFTSDVTGRWSSAWAAWPGAGKLWSQSVRWLLRPEAAGGLSVSLEERAGKARVVAEAADPAGAPLNFLRVEGTWVTPEMARLPLTLAQTAPGRYEAEAPARGAGVYLAHVRAAGEGISLSRSGSLILSYPMEFRDHGAREPALLQLSEMTGGRWNPEPRAAFDWDSSGSRRPVDLSGILLVLAALLLPLDVALRKVRFRAEAWEPVVSSARGLASAGWGRLRRRAAPVQTESAAQQSAPAEAPPSAQEALSAQSAWDRLKEAKKRARKRTQ